MRRYPVLSIAIRLATAQLLLAGTVAAGPNGGGTLIVSDLNLLLSATTTTSPICQQGVEVFECAAADTRIDGASSSDAVALWRVYAAFPLGSNPRVAAVEWGIEYDHTKLRSVADAGAHWNCADYEIPNAGWPAPTPVSGACCLSKGTCRVTTLDLCNSERGIFLHRVPVCDPKACVRTQKGE